MGRRAPSGVQSKKNPYTDVAHEYIHVDLGRSQTASYFACGSWLTRIDKPQIRYTIMLTWFKGATTSPDTSVKRNRSPIITKVAT